MDHAVKDHTNDLETLDKELIPSAENAELKAELIKERGIVAEHLALAIAVHKALGENGDNGQTGGGGQGGQGGQGGGGGGGAGGGNGAGGAGGGSGRRSPRTPQLSDAQILKVLMVANQGEVDQAKLALTKATMPEVRAFAEQMITDHTAALARLTALATTAG